MRKRNAGYSLVEVLIAMAILGTVLMSILTLFVFGRRNVYSGRQMTRATSVSTHVMEDLVPLTPEEFYTTFGITSTTTLGTNTVAGVSYTDSIIRRAADAACGADCQRYFTNWNALLVPARMQDATLALVIMPLDRATASNPTTARRLVIRTVTEWREGPRIRQVSLDITKLNRRF